MRSLRLTFVAVLAAFIVGTAAPIARPTSAGPLPDTTGMLTPWRIEPAIPCVHDSVFMIVRGFVATPCDSFLGAEAIDSLHVRIRTQVYADRACFAAPFIFYPVPVSLGSFAAGPHVGLVDVETIEIRQDSSTTTSTQQFRFGFSVSDQCLPPPPVPPGPLPYVNSIGTVPQQPCATRPTSLVVGGLFTDGCGQVIDSRVIDPGHVELTLKPYVLADTACTLALVPWHVAFDLGTLPAGPHRTEIALTLLVPDSTRTTFLRRTFHGVHDFLVLGDCDSVPSPPPGPLPYVGMILVGPQGNCGPEPVCPGDGIPVRVFGVFPHDCFSFRRIVVIPSPATVFPPLPPTVRIIVDDGGCMGRPCSQQPVPWSAAVRLPPMVAGSYTLPVELAQVTCSDTFPPGQLYRTEVPFSVAPGCPEPLPCLHAGFGPSSGWVPGVCNATISPTHAADVTFRVAPSVALAGLQGEFKLHPSVLRVTGIEAIGRAVGMLLNWTPTPIGAKFVLVAASGAPILPWPLPVSPPEIEPAGGWPVLRVTVAQAGQDPIPDRTGVTAESLLGSDIGGLAVPECPPPPCASGDPWRIFAQAIICAEQACDFNADGVEDIRDLVLMVHCVTGEGPCPPEASTRFDCDGDSLLAIADVLCCARDILGRPRCADCAPDSIRLEPGVAVDFGAPVVSSQGIDLPVRLSGAGRLGAAMLTLDLPLDRYHVGGLDAPGGWLALQSEQRGRLALGMISVRPASPANLGPATFVLHLAPRPGAARGGIVTATAGEFSGPDGVTLGVNLGQPAQALPGEGGVALGPSQPNPFSGETAFTLELVQTADVTVAIFDLRGRLVADLHRAPLAAGPHVFRWDGRQADGSAAPNGIYFYRATVAGQSLARKLILMRGN